MTRVALKRKDLLYPDESYNIVGAAFNVYNTIGSGHHEKYYQRALKEEFLVREIPFREQVYFPLKYHNSLIGKQFFDFLAYDKIVVELKKGNNFSKRHIDQVLAYLKENNYFLGILINFGSNKVLYKRIICQQ